MHINAHARIYSYILVHNLLSAPDLIATPWVKVGLWNCMFSECYSDREEKLKVFI
jgi:hypothetical protein